MTFHALVTIGVIIISLILFISEKLSIDLVALLIITTLVLSGVISPEEGVAGFSNAATVTVAAMFVISAALFKTGAVNMVGPKLGAIIKKSPIIGLFVMMAGVGFVSAFINNTPIVAVFIPVVISACAISGQNASRYLIPLSYATINGGVCSLIGTSTNILVSGLATQNGLPAFSMFQMAPMGIVFFLVGTTYILLFGKYLLPDNKDEKNLKKKFGVREYLTEIVLLEKSPSIGKKIMDSPLIKELEVEIIEIRRKDATFILPPLDLVLMANDIMKIRCNVDKIKELKDRIQIQLNPEIQIGEETLEGRNTTLIEMIIPAHSDFEGKTLEELEFKRTYRAVPLAIKQRNEILHEQLNQTVLKAGDVILMEVKNHRLEEIKQLQSRQESPFILITEEGLTGFHFKKFMVVMLVILGVITSSALNIVPILAASIAGVVILVLGRCIKMTEVYEVIDWKVIFLLAGSLSLGVAMQKSGVAAMIADGLVTYLGGYGPVIILSGLYLITSLLTEIMSNNATAALLVPVAIATAQTLGVHAEPFLMAIAFGASASFATPIGYQTNTMVYTAGGYKFKDFLIVGGGLNIIFWIIASLLIPYFYPFN